ncbi:sensor histidine kinase [Arthrobacter sp. B6]|uniref:sensor histidine kinase n=1 Tax=Arthrobacter sp. B6 TaxID=1570137 RepID=UPI00082CC2A3|nr:ATP-binding protein [Arthrobacter sp. B6]
MSGSGAPVSQGLTWLPAHRFFHELSPRGRVVLGQLPLTATMFLVLGIVWVFHPALLLDPVFGAGLMLHALMFILALGIPWQRLPPAAALAVPVLDFIPVGLIRESGVETVPALGAMAVLPVVWLTSSQLYPRFCLVMSFLGPLLMVWVPLVLRGSVAGEEYSVVVLLPIMMFATGFAVHTLSASRDHQQRTVEEARAQLQAALDSSARKERLVNTVVDAVGVGVLALDAAGKITLRNQQQKRNHALAHPAPAPGSDLAEVRVYGRGGKELLLPEMFPERRAAKGEDFSDYLVWVGENGKQRVFSTSARAILDDGRFDGSVVTFTDVSALVEAMTAKDAFLSNVSHELRTPLTSILGYTEVLAARNDLPSEAGVMLKVVRRNGQRLQRLVTDLLTAASGSVDVRPEPADLAEIIGFSLATAAPQAGAAGVNLVNEADAEVPALIDPTRMGQVLDNLFSNAIKYSPDGGTVTVRAGATEEGVFCSVTDTGIGMRQEDLKELFTKFFRSETARKSGIPGIGLGLAITRTIVENHGGSIKCTSTPGKGSTFTVTLPASR